MYPVSDVTFLGQRVIPGSLSAGLESNAATHEAWVASLVPPPEAPLTPAEASIHGVSEGRHPGR